MEAEKPVLAERTFRDLDWDEHERQSIGQRFHLPPTMRLPIIAFIAGAYGMISGGRKGFRESGDRFLVENSHRLPITKGGWYFYHKRKNWECIRAALKSGLKTSFKYSLSVSSFFGTEALLDQLRGEIDFLNTLVTTTLFGVGYAKFYKLNRTSSIKMIKNGVAIGLFGGLLQDSLIYLRGGDVWYIKKMKTFMRNTNPPLEA